MRERRSREEGPFPSRQTQAPGLQLRARGQAPCPGWEFSVGWLSARLICRIGTTVHSCQGHTGTEREERVDTGCSARHALLGLPVYTWEGRPGPQARGRTSLVHPKGALSRN